MSVRLYLAPVETIVDARGRTMRRVKYVDAIVLPPKPMVVQYYGMEPHCLLAAEVTTAQHDSLVLNADVTAIPLNLDLEIGPNIATVHAALEARNVPSDMVTSRNTYRQVVRGVLAVFSISASTPLFGAGVTLDTTLGDLTPAVRAELKASAESSGYETTGLALTSTIRDALRKAVARAALRVLLGLEV